jgi:hypothetical protein
MVCRPKKKGGLDVIKLRLHNEALLMKTLAKKKSPRLICLGWIWFDLNTMGMVKFLAAQRKDPFGGEIFYAC